MNPVEEQYFLDLATKVIAKRATLEEIREFEVLLSQSSEHRERFETFKTDVIVAKDIMTLVSATEAKGPGLTPDQFSKLKKEIDAIARKHTIRRWLIGLVILILLVVSSLIAYKIIIRPNPETPEGLLSILTTPKIYEQNIKLVRDHQTVPIGTQVWDWLSQQTWFKEKGIGKIEERRNDGSRKELVVVYDSVDGIEKYSVVFYKENGILKFHDVYIYEMMGDKYGMYLSHILRDRKIAQEEFDRQNTKQNKNNLFSTFK